MSPGSSPGWGFLQHPQSSVFLARCILNTSTPPPLPPQRCSKQQQEQRGCAAPFLPGLPRVLSRALSFLRPFNAFSAISHKQLQLSQSSPWDSDSDFPLESSLLAEPGPCPAVSGEVSACSEPGVVISTCTEMDLVSRTWGHARTHPYQTQPPSASAAPSVPVIRRAALLCTLPGSWDRSCSQRPCAPAFSAPL